MRVLCDSGWMKHRLQDESVSGTRAPTPMEQRSLETPARRPTGGGCSRESPDFGGGVDYHDLDAPRRERLPDGTRESPPRSRQNNTPPEDQNPRGCSLHSMEPLRDWFCKGSGYDVSIRIRSIPMLARE